MRILILDDAALAPAALQSMLPDVFDENTATDTGIFAALSLPGIVMSRLTRSHAHGDGVKSQLTQPTQDPLAPFHMEDCPELTPTALDTFGLACLASGRLDEAEQFIKTGLEMRLKFFGEGHPELAKSYNSLARVFRDASKLEAAIDQVLAAKGIDQQVFGENSLAVAADLAVLSSIQLQQGHLESARETAISAKAIFDEKLNGNDPWVPYLLDIIARVHQGLSQYSQAEALYQQLLPLDVRYYGACHPVVATHSHNNATVLEGKGDLVGAESMYSKTIAILEQHGSNIHPQMIDAIANRGAVRRMQKDFDNAREDMETALRLNQEFRGEQHPFTGYDLLNLGSLEVDSRNPDKALTYFSKALAIFRQTLPEHHGYIAAALTNQGRALLDLQQAAEAEKPLQEALKIWSVEYGKQSVEFAVANATLARAWYLQGKERNQIETILRASVTTISAIKPETDNSLVLIRGWLTEVTGRSKAIA
jgi:tetratricopeptide (TPR) repeat protein